MYYFGACNTEDVMYDQGPSITTTNFDFDLCKQMVGR